MARRTDRGEKAALTGPGGEPPNKRLKRDADSLAAAARLSRNVRQAKNLDGASVQMGYNDQ
jgi:hypothetical protein